MDVEDRAAAALAADEPIPLSCVAEPKGSAADLATRHCNVAARTDWHFPGRELAAYLLKLGRRVLRQSFVNGRVLARAFRAIIVGHQSGIRTTIFPNCCPLWSRSNAARPGAMSNTESTTGK